MPAGVPKIILPFIFLMEILSLFIKTFALMIRLFANMLAGHMLDFIFAGHGCFIWLVRFRPFFWQWEYRYWNF